MTEVAAIDSAIAVVGMAGRFPSAPDIEAFWTACVEARNCISRWDGPGAAGYVSAGGLLAGKELFDAVAFGISPAEAEILDPQHRIFLELCWHALEQASVVPGRAVPVSVYAAAAPSRYKPTLMPEEGVNLRYQRMIANEPDYLATRVSYLLDLCGEAVNVQTACSSSLVAVHLACLSLQSGRSDFALAGGVSIDPEQEFGYVYEEGMITSPNGRCLPFDVEACGSVPGGGAAVVVLQRLSDALAQQRPIHAIIRATAINNDGRNKASFMAPNVEGQSEVIATAIAAAGMPVETIQFLETHGTATRLGDAIEIEAARTAFRYFTEQRSFCALGSLKANFGHLDRAAGVAGLIKAVLAVREGTIPPMLGFKDPNPDLSLPASPFRVPTQAEPWCTDVPRRAGVSSFGVGGTNAHAIVEEYLGGRKKAHCVATPNRLIAWPLSAHCEQALARIGRDVAEVLKNNAMPLDVAHTLSAGRIARSVRTVVIAAPHSASQEFANLPIPSTIRRNAGSLAILFPGQGMEVGYGASRLAKRFEVFRAEIEAFADALEISIDELLDGVSGDDKEYREFAYQPALVAVQVALARLAESFGVVGDAFCGNSLGEYAAAFMAGVFDRPGLMAALKARDRVMRAAPEGRMLAVQDSTEAVLPLIQNGVDFAGENWNNRVLLSGAPSAIRHQFRILEGNGVLARILPGRIGPHGHLMAYVAEEFREAFNGIVLTRPSRPIVSTLTGGWSEPDQLTEVGHWVSHLCQSFQFRSAFETLTKSGFDRFAEASPGGALTKIVRASGTDCIVATLGGEADTDPTTSFLAALGELWSSGTAVDWDAINASSNARFATLTPYPFERQRFWAHSGMAGFGSKAQSNEDGLLEHPVWRPAPIDEPSISKSPLPPVIIYGDGNFANALICRLREIGAEAIKWVESDVRTFSKGSILVDVSRTGPVPPSLNEPKDAATLSAWLQYGMLQSLEALCHVRPDRLMIVTRALWPATPGDDVEMALAGTVGLARSAPHDLPGTKAQIVDLGLSEDTVEDLNAIIRELCSPDDADVTYRGSMRYRRTNETTMSAKASPLRNGGTYLVLGGTGRLGAVVAEAISRQVNATIILVGRDICRRPNLQTEPLINKAVTQGCVVQRLAAHTDEREELHRLLDDVTAQYGRIDGIFHLAANTQSESYKLLSEITPVSAFEVARTKVITAALLIDDLLHREYDFVVLFSSISTVIGAARFGPYIAANAYLDALAVSMSRKTGRIWRSLVWDGWAEDGVAGPTALGFHDGASLMLRALGAESPVIALVRQPLERRLAMVRADLATVTDASRKGASSDEGVSIEDHIAKIVADVTKHTEIDPQQNLVSLGVDSLRLMQIVTRLQSVLGKSAGTGRLLTAKTVAELVALVTASNCEDQSHNSEVEVHENELSTPQERLWYLAQLYPDTSSYNVPFGWCAPPDLAPRVRETIIGILKRHDALRSAYKPDSYGAPRRHILPVQNVPITEVDLLQEGRDTSFIEIIRDVVEMPFDLEQGSTRVVIVTAEDGIRIVFVCHHISIDAWSVKLLYEDLLQGLLGASIDLRGAKYCDFVRWEREMRLGPQYKCAADYWRVELRDAVPTLPPPDTAVVSSHKGEATQSRRSVATLGRDQMELLQAVLRDEGITLFVAGLTGLAIALSRWCGQHDLVIGVNVANRMRKEFESVVGLFVDPVVLRLFPDLGHPDMTLRSALRNVRERFASAVAHSGIPYLDVVKLCGRRSTAVDNPLFSVIATMFDTEIENTSLTSLDVPLPADSKFALAIEFLPTQAGLKIHALYASDRYLSKTIDLVLDQILCFLEGVAASRCDQLLTSVMGDFGVPSSRKRFSQRFDRFKKNPSMTES